MGKKFFVITLFLVITGIETMNAQDTKELARECKTATKTGKSLEDMFFTHSKLIDEKTLDKVANTKTLVGQKISLRPDNNYGKTNRKFVFSTYEANHFDKTIVTSDDVLMVVKAKKDELTLTLGEKKVILLRGDFRRFMLRSDLETFAQMFQKQKEDAQQEEIRLKQEAEERAEREKNEAEKKQREESLKAYWAAIEKFNKTEEGPVAIKKAERAYDGLSPYWKWQSNGNHKLDTYLDEKFMLSPHRFARIHDGIKKKLKRTPNDKNLNHLDNLATMQKDTFGILDWKTLINLRTGDTFRDEEDFKMWESINYLKNLEKQDKYVYDGSVSLEYALGGINTPYRERIFEGIKGERVFFLDSMKYDVIVGFEETLRPSVQTVLLLQNRGKEGLYNCISVKWYEQLQKMVGKRALDGSDFSYFEDDRLWKEDIDNNLVAYTIDAVEVKDHELLVTLTNQWNKKTETVNALKHCNLLACPIDFAVEKEKRKAKENYLGLHREYVSYDAAIATMPAKPQAVKKKESEDKAFYAEHSRKMKKLRNHELIGIFLTAFLKEYPGAELLNTTINNGITVKVYVYSGYRLIFQNGMCVSQTTLEKQ